VTTTDSERSWQPSASLDVMQRRAKLLYDIREFFQARDVLEVDTPVLSRAANTDANIDSLQLTEQQQDWYLHTSPEFPMKRLLASGSGDIYQVCKVFRQGEQGQLHNPEFTMLEWYRCGYSLQDLMDEVAELITQLADKDVLLDAALQLSYQDAFQTYLKIDPFESDTEQLRACATSADIADAATLQLNKDGWLDLLLSMLIVPQFPENKLVLLHHYPASQAALASLDANDPRSALRFELFINGVEIANGYDELSDADELQKRFEQDNAHRENQEKAIMPIDYALLEAQQAGLPQCAGVAMGLDRLLLLLSGATELSEVLAFDASRA